MLDAESKGKVCVVVLFMGERLAFEVGEEGGFVGGRVRGVDRDESVVDGRVGRIVLVDFEEEVADCLILGK